MPTYRPSEAITHWRHLTVIATAANVNGTAVAGEAVSPAVREAMRDGVCRWSARATQYTLGMCWFQNDVFFFPNEWTWGRPYTYFEPDGWVTTLEDLEEGCATVGVRPACYDSTSFLVPSITSHNYASGLTLVTGAGGDHPHSYHYWIPYDHTAWSGETWVEFIADVATHEFGHVLSLYFGDYGHGLPMAWPDGPSLYEHLDGTPLDNDSTDPPHDDFAYCLYNGDLRAKDTLLPAGCSADVWALGAPRANWPR